MYKVLNNIIDMTKMSLQIWKRQRRQRWWW